MGSSFLLTVAAGVSTSVTRTQQIGQQEKDIIVAAAARSRRATFVRDTITSDKSHDGGTRRDVFWDNPR